MKTILTLQGRKVSVWSEQANELEAEVSCEWPLAEFKAVFPDAKIEGIKSIQHEEIRDEYFVMENGEIHRDHDFSRWIAANQDRLREEAVAWLLRQSPVMEDFYNLDHYLK